jgi:hypothetical protein
VRPSPAPAERSGLTQGHGKRRFASLEAYDRRAVSDQRPDSRATPEQLRGRAQLTRLFRETPLPEADLLVNLHLYRGARLLQSCSI